MFRPRCAAPMTCPSATRHSTVSRSGSGTCSFPTSPGRPPSSRGCSGRADACARRYGPGYVSALYQAAGLHEVAEQDVGVELVTDSPAQYWEMISEHVSLAVAALAQAGEPARERIAKAVIARADAYEQDGRVRIPGMARCIAGTK
jgi:hypothetical protein